MDYKEYSRLRSIARKRIERAAKAGITENIRIPTVAEVRASADPGMYMSAVKSFLNTPGSSIKWLRADDTLSFPTIKLPPTPPVTKPTGKQKKEQERWRNKLSKARSRIRKDETSEDAKQKASYLKALDTLIKNWEQNGVKAGSWIRNMTPKQLQYFTDYLEYRFSQGDYTQRYVIDTFVKDFGTLVRKKNYDLGNFQNDFETFLSKQKQLSENKTKADQYGITADSIGKLWKKFVKRRN